MSRNYELLRQLEEMSPRAPEPAPPLRSEEQAEAVARPKPEQVFYSPSPKVNELPLRQVPPPKPSAAAEEEIARLVESLVLAQNGRELRSIVFCGIEDTGASSIVCASAGRGLAARAESVCLIDVNVRERYLSRRLGISPHVPLKGDPA